MADKTTSKTTSHKDKKDKDRKMLASWTRNHQDAYRTKHPHESLLFTFLLDASPSMLGEKARALRQSFNMYLAWLKAHASPMALAEIRCFADYLEPPNMTPLGLLTPLTDGSYDPAQGSGTALYRAIGETCMTPYPDAQHILVVFTDGLDNRSADCGWTLANAHAALTERTKYAWLGVFLGAMPEALDIGQALGFAKGNCLLMTTDTIPDAFRSLTFATQRYLTAGPGQRKLLAQVGVF
jgi:hypothetical protein